jgi:phosphoribosylanthranilate isomerase
MAVRIMMVKICGITNLEDAKAAVDAGAAAIGFNFYHDSPRYVSPTGASLIASKLGADVIKVGVFVDEKPDFVTKVAIQVGLDVAQLHGFAEALGIRKWRVARANESLDEYIADESIEALLVDTPSDKLLGGTGETFDWSLVRGLEKQIIVAGGLDASNVREAIEQARPWGVDACSRLEKSPGLKDHEKMKRFIEAALEG